MHAPDRDNQRTPSLRHVRFLSKDLCPVVFEKTGTQSKKCENFCVHIYTGPGYSKLNGLLRMGKEEIARLRQEGKNTFTA
jgi:hypothetical protein